MDDGADTVGSLIAGGRKHPWVDPFIRTHRGGGGAIRFHSYL